MGKHHTCVERPVFGKQFLRKLKSFGVTIEGEAYYGEWLEGKTHPLFLATSSTKVSVAVCPKDVASSFLLKAAFRAGAGSHVLLWHSH